MIWIQFLATALARAVILVDDGIATGSGIMLPLMPCVR
jgi:predicted phosphoribosyltransferase